MDGLKPVTVEEVADDALLDEPEKGEENRF